MFPALVIGNVWATRKDSRVEGIKLLIVRPLDYLNENAVNSPIIAADWIGAGVGERVIVVSGSAARCAAGDQSIPIDASVIGIIDGEDIVSKNEAGGQT
ncbi:MAG: EutN/CcmL family microcompartment protein [Oscillospiraceae bacterium]|nr:EutN/CcmL family microcompartment protein [Oscillospiraceae bacterium]